MHQSPDKSALFACAIRPTVQQHFRRISVSCLLSMGRSGRVVECGGLEIRQVVRPSDTNQQLTAQSITQIWGVLGGFGSKMCNRMCNSVFRIVQECLSNIHRHSESKIAVIRVARQADSISVEVRDQGKGMTAERLAEIQLEDSGVGIRGIRERLRQFKGQMNIESDNSGTRILISIPIPKNMTFKEHAKIEPLQAE